MTRVDDLKKKILPYRKQEELLDKWLVDRLDNILPKVMKRSGIDAWVVACNEYNEDPVLRPHRSLPHCFCRLPATYRSIPVSCTNVSYNTAYSSRIRPLSEVLFRQGSYHRSEYYKTAAVHQCLSF